MKKQPWYDLMDSLGFPENEKELKFIINTYQEPHRKYHNLNHLNDCLQKCQLNDETKTNSELQLAFWYHDLIYKPLKKDNEYKSALRAEKFITNQTQNKLLIKKVKDLIMITLHNQLPKNIDEAFMIDIDISILGADIENYSKYSKNIRAEYKYVPWFIYKKKRIEILEMFLEKKNLYYTDYFKEELEEKARLNIQYEINTLKDAT